MAKSNQMTIKLRMDDIKSPPAFELFGVEVEKGDNLGDNQPNPSNFECLKCHAGYVVAHNIIKADLQSSKMEEDEKPYNLMDDLMVSSSSSDSSSSLSSDSSSMSGDESSEIDEELAELGKKIEEKLAEEDARVECTECNKIYPSKSSLVAHKAYMHTEEMQICEICQKDMSCTKYEYLSHLRRRHPTQIPNKAIKETKNFSNGEFPCAYCDEDVIFAAFEQLKDHLEKIHNRKSACSICPRAYDKNKALQKHQKDAH